MDSRGGSGTHIDRIKHHGRFASEPAPRTMDTSPVRTPSEERYQSPLFRDGRVPEILDNFRWAPLTPLPDPPQQNAAPASPTSYPLRKQSVPCSVSGDEDEEITFDGDPGDEYCITFFHQRDSVESPVSARPDPAYLFPPVDSAPTLSRRLRSTPAAHRVHDSIDSVDYLPASSKAAIFSAPIAETQPLRIRHRRSLSSVSLHPPTPPPKDAKWTRPRLLTSVESPWSNASIDPALLQATLAAGHQSRTVRREQPLRAVTSSPALNRAKSYPSHTPTGENATLADQTRGRKPPKQRHPHSAGFLAPLHTLTNSIGNSIGSFVHDALHTPITIPRRPQPQHGQSFNNLFAN